ncbi:MAG: class I SAM-dependent methyltransferase [Clostridia bacterium]|nr:class I SAM-dependent methyltransferase [Clostridia bacterium]
MDRINKLCAYLDKCQSFADVACDHGYCAQYMLKNNLCQTAVVSDVSAKCLQKAEKLLAPYISCGKCYSVCCDGLEKISEATDQILIAGLGGEELVKILSSAYIPRSFTFQPMKNAQKVREYLIANGAEITADEPFESGGKFYFVIKGKKSGGKTSYTKAQLLYGKNLKSEVTKKYINCELAKKQSYLLRNLNDGERQKIQTEINFMKGVLGGEIE